MKEFAYTGDPLIDVPALIRWRGNGLTFVELLGFLPYLKGDYFYWVGNNSIVAWIGVSQECIHALQDLLLNEQISLHSTQPLTYLIDGCALKLPLAKSVRQYKKPHWLPVTFSVPKVERGKAA
jgi:hypothetical protein